MKKKSLSETFKALREIGSAWDDVICVCRGLMKDSPCDVNCKEFNDESLTNSFKERELLLLNIRSAKIKKNGKYTTKRPLIPDTVLVLCCDSPCIDIV